MRRLKLGMTAAVLAALLAVAARPDAVAAQRRGTFHHITTDNGHTVSVRMSGEVELDDEGRAVRHISPGGRLVVEEELRGGRSRRAEFWATSSGELRRAYWRDGEARAFDADAQAWVERILEEAARESALGAERRVARLRQRGGVRAVLDYVDDIKSDGAKRAYYAALLKSGGLGAGEVAATLEAAGRRIESDGERRYVLKTALDQGLRGAEAWAAFFAAADRISSDGERRYLLKAALDHGLPGRAEWTALLRSTARMDSDGEQRYVLGHAAARAPLHDAAVRQAFFGAVDTIDSDGERAYVLTTLLRREGVSAEVAAAAVESAREMGSDGEKAHVLTRVPRHLLADRRVGAAYTAAAESIGSDGERARALVHFTRSRP